MVSIVLILTSGLSHKSTFRSTTGDENRLNCCHKNIYLLWWDVVFANKERTQMHHTTQSHHPPWDRQVVPTLCPHQKVTIVHRVFYWASIKQISLCRAAKVTFVRHPGKCPQTTTETLLLLNNNKIDWIITVVSVPHDIKKKPSPPSTKEEDLKCH